MTTGPNPLARAVVSGFIVLALTSMLVSNLPDSAVRRAAMPAVEPFLDLTGLHQNWNLFAPDPRRTTFQLEARITYADGSTAAWRPPAGGAFVGVYRTFRWRKWASNVLSSQGSSLLAPAADWVARTHPRDGTAPVKVVLVKRFYVAPRPGSGATERPPWREQTLYTARYGSEP